MSKHTTSVVRVLSVTMTRPLDMLAGWVETNVIDSVSKQRQKSRAVQGGVRQLEVNACLRRSMLGNGMKHLPQK